MSKSHVSARPSNGIFQFVRRVPAFVADVDCRVMVRQSLGTRDLHTALAKARVIDEGLEDYWHSLLANKSARSDLDQYQSAVLVAKAMGFAYRPAPKLAEGAIEDLLQRIDVIGDNVQNKAVVDGLLGGAGEPELRISGLWEAYEKHHKAELIGYSENQLRKHKVPRERAIRYLQAHMGDKALSEICRADVLNYRDWWIEKMKKEGLRADSLNRSFSDIKGMLTVIDNALQSTNYGAVWERVRIKKTNATEDAIRPPFAAEFVQEKILKAGSLDSLNHEARMLVYLLIETGLRPSEACNLRPQDIRLDAKVPHISVSSRADRRLKTKHSERTVPLVGVALWAMKQAPKGFPRYLDKGDALSASVNKALQAAGLRPTKRHVLYSLRHTFQDRILKAGAPDRLQADLMGHEFERPAYGDGASLEQKLALLDRIKFVWEEPTG